jgi:hypothetical protein
MEKKRLIFYFYPMPSKFSKRPVNQVFPLFNGKRAIPSIAGLKQLLEYHGVELQKETLEQLWAYHQLLREHNKNQDLTRLNAFETIVERHYADCTLINAYVPEWPKRMIDSSQVRNYRAREIHGMHVAVKNNFHRVGVSKLFVFSILVERFYKSSYVGCLLVETLHHCLNLLGVNEWFIALHINNNVFVATVDLVGFPTTVGAAAVL